MPACEQAVAIEPDNGEWGSARCPARALTADSEGAITDSERYAARERRNGRRERHQGWIGTLRATSAYGRVGGESIGYFSALIRSKGKAAGEDGE